MTSQETEKGAAASGSDPALLAERSFPATTEGLAGAQAFLEEYQESPKPAIIIDEIVSNIVRCSGATGFTIRVFAEGEQLFRMEFIDDGRAFDPTREIAEPDVTAGVEDRQIGGLGMFMVKKMSKSVAYVRDGSCNRLTVVL